MDLTVEQRVQNGVMWLDATVPGWWKKIDLNIFSLISCSRCVLGQVFKDYMDKSQYTHGFLYAIDRFSELDTAKYGFGGFVTVSRWRAATNLWCEIIAERQGVIMAPKYSETLVEV